MDDTLLELDTIESEIDERLATKDKLQDLFIDLQSLERRLKARLSRVGELRKLVDPAMMGWMLEDIQAESIKHKRGTISTRRDIYASKANGFTTESFATRLKDLGLGHLVKEGVNATSLSAHVRGAIKEAERDADEESLINWDEFVKDTLGEDLANIVHVSLMHRPTFTPSETEKTRR